MRKKNFLLFNSIGTLFLTPSFFIVSCSKNNPTSTDSQRILNAINTNVIKISIEGISNNQVKITDLKNLKFNFSLIRESNENDTQKKFYDEIQESLNKSKIEFFGYYLPKLNDDNGSSVFLKINNDSNSIAEVKLSQIWNGNEKLQLANLSDVEIQNLIKEKLYEDKNFINKVRNFLDYQIIQNFKNYNNSVSSPVTFETYWNDTVKIETTERLKNFIVGEYPYLFDSVMYQNIFIAPLDLVSSNNQTSFTFSLKISTNTISNTQTSNEVFSTNLTLYP